LRRDAVFLRLVRSSSHVRTLGTKASAVSESRRRLLPVCRGTSRTGRVKLSKLAPLVDALIPRTNVAAMRAHPERITTARQELAVGR
jgi:hypothetical protein